MIRKHPVWTEHYHGYQWSQIWQMKVFAFCLMEHNVCHYLLGWPFTYLLKLHERYHQWTRKNDCKNFYCIMFGAGDGIKEKLLLIFVAWWMTLLHRLAGSWYCSECIKNLQDVDAQNEP